jgi:hypothetical protein
MELSMEKNCAKLHTCKNPTCREKKPLCGILKSLSPGYRRRNGKQQQYLIEYRAQRKFSATNLRFKADATLEVMTTFRRPNTLESQVLGAEGSKIIRKRVFLEAENETNATKLTKQQIDIVPANYSFSYL